MSSLGSLGELCVQDAHREIKVDEERHPIQGCWLRGHYLGLHQLCRFHPRRQSGTPPALIKSKARLKPILDFEKAVKTICRVFRKNPGKTSAAIQIDMNTQAKLADEFWDTSAARSKPGTQDESVFSHLLGKWLRAKP